MPGGVSSPVRAFKSVGGNPIVFDRVKGAYAWDVDGNKFIDYVGTWGPAILGHADDDVLNAVKKTMDKGEFLLGQLSANVFVAHACVLVGLRTN
jgi:glutamate-1-semialdehyde 2,1-aminomutase